MTNDVLILLYRLACAIATAEGWFNGNLNSIPRQMHNPGDLMWAGQKNASAGLPHGNGYFAKFHMVINGVDHSDLAGILGLYRDLLAKAAEGLTTRQAISVWAPKVDGNDTENYIKETARRAGITDVDVPLILLPIVSIEVIP